MKDTTKRAIARQWTYIVIGVPVGTLILLFMLWLWDREFDRTYQDALLGFWVFGYFLVLSIHWGVRTLRKKPSE